MLRPPRNARLLLARCIEYNTRARGEEYGGRGYASPDSPHSRPSEIITSKRSTIRIQYSSEPFYYSSVQSGVVLSFWSSPIAVHIRFLGDAVATSPPVSSHRILTKIPDVRDAIFENSGCILKPWQRSCFLRIYGWLVSAQKSLRPDCCVTTLLFAAKGTVAFTARISSRKRLRCHAQSVRLILSRREISHPSCVHPEGTVPLSSPV
jgi:hypothetical protein